MGSDIFFAQTQKKRRRRFKTHNYQLTTKWCEVDCCLFRSTVIFKFVFCFLFFCAVQESVARKN